MIDDSEWEELIEEVGGDAYAARELAVRRRSSTRSIQVHVIHITIRFTRHVKIKSKPIDK